MDSEVTLASSWDVSSGSLETVFRQTSPTKKIIADKREDCTVLARPEGESTPCHVAAVFNAPGAHISCLTLVSSARFVEIYSTNGDSVSGMLVQGGGEYLGTVRCTPLHDTASSLETEAADEGTTKPGRRDSSLSFTRSRETELETECSSGPLKAQKAKWMEGSLDLSAGDGVLEAGAVEGGSRGRHVHGLLFKFLGIPPPKDCLVLGSISFDLVPLTPHSADAPLPPPDSNRAAVPGLSQSMSNMEVKSGVHSMGVNPAVLAAIAGVSAGLQPRTPTTQATHLLPDARSTPANLQMMGRAPPCQTDTTSANKNLPPGLSNENIPSGMRDLLAAIGQQRLQGVPSGFTAVAHEMVQRTITASPRIADCPPVQQQQPRISRHEVENSGVLLERLVEHEKKLQSVVASLAKTSQGLQTQMDALVQRVGNLEKKMTSRGSLEDNGCRQEDETIPPKDVSRLDSE